MSNEIYELTNENINQGYRDHELPIIEKETDYIMGKIVTVLLSMFPDKIVGIALDKYGIKFDGNYLLSEKHQKNLKTWLQRLAQTKLPSSDMDFGKLKVDLEHWYYQMGGDEVQFSYPSSYLLTPKEASDHLGVSRVTLNKYIQQGLEVVDTNSHRKIPKYTVELWEDPVYAIRMQMNAQEKKLRNQSPAERLEELNYEITQLEIKYKSGSVKEAFAAYDGDSMDDPSDYYLWRDLETEKKEIMKLLGGS
ncbi:helix-turn-helix domain-containing protein [Virgibacillus sp. CBA3643]|uniref:helix-turn-helix domain-containing protein n=1 Tax=Virgibacillus sp. CBA3643 TaxID=2942278 RepID=UPI0035A2CABF